MNATNKEIPNSSWLKTLSIGFSIISFGITVAIIGYIVLTTKQNQPANQQPIATWEVYTNAEYGFEVRYPEKWQVSVSKSAGPEDSVFIQFRAPQSDRRKRTQINLHISDSPTSTLEKYIETSIVGRDYTLSSIEDFSIGGIPAKKAVITGGDVAGEGPYVLFLTLYREKVYHWDGTDQSILVKILSTFKFSN